MSRRETWRDQSRPLVAEVLQSGKAQGLKDRELLRYAFRSSPWRWCGYHPHRIWCNEVRRQLAGENTAIVQRRKPDPGQLAFDFGNEPTGVGPYRGGL